MKLAKIAEGKRTKKAFIPLFALLVISLFLSSGTVSAVDVYQLNNTFYDPNYETNPGVFSELIDPWTIKESHSGDYQSYVGPTALVCYPNEGIQYGMARTSFPSEFNFTSRMFFFSWPDNPDDDNSPMFQLCSQGWNTAGAGYIMTSFQLNDKYENGTYRFRYIESQSNYGYIYVTSGSSYVYTLLANVHVNTTSYSGTVSYHFLWELSSSEPGDEHYYNDTENNFAYQLFETTYIRLGGYSGGQYTSSGYTWIKFAKMWWDNGVTPDTTPPSSTEETISDLVSQIVFFIPILVLTSFFGRIGFMGGVGLMSVIWIFSNADFVASGILMLVALGILVYKGGMQ